MTTRGVTGIAARATTVAGLALSAALTAALAGCAGMDRLHVLGSPADSSPPALSTVETIRSALASGNLAGAEAVLGPALAPAPSADGTNPASPNTVRGGPNTADLLELRAELRIRQARYAEAESDALTAMALLPATPSADEAATAGAATGPLRRFLLTQRGVHIRLAQLLEDAGRDDNAEQHLQAAIELCKADAALAERGACERERQALVRIRLSRGHYSEAEPLVLAEIADVQSRFGADDIRLSFAFCDVARFYARQGKYSLSGPLYARSFDLWKTVRDDAFSLQSKARTGGEPSPFDADFLRPRAGHAPFATPCGLEEQASLLFKLDKAPAASDAIRFEQHLWADDTEAGIAAITAMDALILRSADVLDVASARHAVAFVAQKKGDAARAEQELRTVVESYAAAWPTLARSERRFRTEDYLNAIESLVEILRSSKRFGEAITLGERASQIANETVDAYDAVRLDTLLSLAKTYREMRQPEQAEVSAGTYLDAVVAARGDTSPDYAFALRTISFAYLLRGELDASGRMEMQAKAIWAKQTTVAPEF